MNINNDITQEVQNQEVKSFIEGLRSTLSPYGYNFESDRDGDYFIKPIYEIQDILKSGVDLTKLDAKNKQNSNYSRQPIGNLIAKDAFVSKGTEDRFMNAVVAVNDFFKYLFRFKDNGEYVVNNYTFLDGLFCIKISGVTSMYAADGGKAEEYPGILNCIPFDVEDTGCYLYDIKNKQ